jgi:hypothetical protein
VICCSIIENLPSVKKSSASRNRKKQNAALCRENDAKGNDPFDLPPFGCEMAALMCENSINQQQQVVNMEFEDFAAWVQMRCNRADGAL